MPYTTDESQNLTRDQHPSAAKDIRKSTGDREGDGRGYRPTTRNPDDVISVVQLLANLLQNSGWQQQSGRDCGNVGKSHELFIVHVSVSVHIRV